MSLYYRQLGKPDAPALIFLHGLLGSGINWRRIAQAFENDYQIILPDLRNHGRSFHQDSMSYFDLAADVLHLMEELQLLQPVVIGHSLGGKTAMVLAAQHPLTALVVVDIAPVRYQNPFFQHLLQLMLDLPLDRIESRQQAKDYFMPVLNNRALVDYILQNLAYDRQQGWYWRCHLSALLHHLDEIQSFPELQCPYNQPTLFIKGTESDYISAEGWARVQALCPQAKLNSISGAGHWVYAQYPQAFIDHLQAFLTAFNR